VGVRRTDEGAGQAFGCGELICGYHSPNVRIEGTLVAELAWTLRWKPPRGHLLTRRKTQNRRRC
jgi:hypothetical protein